MLQFEDLGEVKIRGPDLIENTYEHLIHCIPKD